MNSIWIWIFLVIIVILLLVVLKKKNYKQESSSSNISLSLSGFNVAGTNTLTSGILIYLGNETTYCTFDNSTTDCSSFNGISGGNMYGAWVDNIYNVHTIEIVDVPTTFTGINIDADLGITFLGTLSPYSGKTDITINGNNISGSNGYLVGLDSEGNSYGASLNTIPLGMNICNGSACQYYYATFANDALNSTVLTNIYDNTTSQCYNDLIINSDSSTYQGCAPNSLCFSNPTSNC